MSSRSMDQINANHAGHKNTATVMEHNANHEGHLSIHDKSVQVSWHLSTPNPQPNEDISVTIEIRDNNGKPLENFEISHEKKMHLIVVSKDLFFFNHVHPEYKGKGVFKVITRFPSGGEYKLVSDFVPEGAGSMTKHTWITVSGEPNQPEPIQPDQSLIKVVHGKQVTLSFDQLITVKPLTMTFTFKDSNTNNPITDLQSYLGAIGHVVVFSSDAEQYIHNHPIEEHTTGPEAKFMTSYPKAGIYKIWGQFKHDDTLFLVSYVVEVPS